MRTVKLLIPLCAVFVLTGCQKKAPKSDATPPQLHLSHFEKNSSGGQGVQKTITPGQQTEVPGDWLGPIKSDIRVYGEDDPGVIKLQVSGTATGECVVEGSQFVVAPSPLSASFPQKTEKVDQGFIKEFLAIQLDDLIAKPSCGFHQYANMPEAKEFFMKRGTWTITAHTENCCGGTADGTFTLVVK